VRKDEETLDLAGGGSFGDLAVASPDGRYVYATFDRLAAGQGGVAKVDVDERTVVDTFLYSGNGRAHGIAYVPRRGRNHWSRPAVRIRTWLVRAAAFLRSASGQFFLTNPLDHAAAMH
jgi:hypothetical protein